MQTHLLSGQGSGRWQFWTAAVDEWRDHPLRGLGAGSFEQWWSEHASFTYFVRDAHSLYLETLGELGLVGFVLVIALVLLALVEGARRALGADGDARVTAAALTAAFAGYAFAAGVDWMWEMTAVSVVGFVALGLVDRCGDEHREPCSTRPAGRAGAAQCAEAFRHWCRDSRGRLGRDRGAAHPAARPASDSTERRSVAARRPQRRRRRSDCGTRHPAMGRKPLHAALARLRATG